MSEFKEFAVDLIVTTEHSYTVLARTAEEAVSIAEDMLDEGDEGTITSSAVESADAVGANETVDAFDDEEGIDIEFEPREIYEN